MPAVASDVILGRVLIAAWVLLGCVSAAHAVMYKRDPRSATIWVVISFALPIIGPWLYWALGINRVRRRASQERRWAGRPVDRPALTIVHPTPDPADEAIAHLAPLRNVADRVTHLPLLPGNRVEPLHNGEQAYPRMLDSIASAERTVTLASYVFDWDDVGRSFTEALEQAARRGVKVHILVDGVGALGHFSRMGRLLMQCKVEVAAFFPLRFPFGRFRLNLRNHRKILVVDGRVGFTGGMNISQRYLVTRPAPGRVEDLHFEVQGPVVAELQHTFVEDWALATNRVLMGEEYFPELSPAGPALCRGIASGPDEDLERVYWILLAALTTAQRSVRIVTPYFVPTLSLITAMGTAALRGVDVTLVLPSTVDRPFMRWVADAYLWQLLERGVKVVRRPPPFVHTKLLIVDEQWLLIGSANLDPRSFRLNFELNVEVYAAELGGRLSRWLDALVDTSQRVTLNEMDSRPPWRRLRDGLAKLASPYL